MNVTIDKQKESLMLGRKDIVATINFEGATPSNADVRRRMAAALKADESLVKIKNIYTKFGATSAKVNACVYESKQDAERYELKPKTGKAGTGAAAAEGEQ